MCYFLKLIIKVEPGLIRVEADEVTYPMHVILRFKLEQALLADSKSETEGGVNKVDIKDIPTVWNARMKETLGLDVPSDAKGVLQDVHWGMGKWVG